MLAASYWSLLAPAIEIAEQSPLYGPDGRYAFVPAAIGFSIGAFSMHFTEKILPFITNLTKPQDLSKKYDDPVEAKKHSPDAMKSYGVEEDANRWVYNKSCIYSDLPLIAIDESCCS